MTLQSSLVPYKVMIHSTLKNQHISKQFGRKSLFIDYISPGNELLLSLLDSIAT